MRVPDHAEAAASNSLEALPTFDIDFFVDDRENPTRVMLMPASLDPGSSEQWITVDADHAVPLDEVR